ncbi:hypothetical protein ACHAAC_16580 [Aeromicrobium sp. CF4.19]|uniref:hypothetical protein n=1 Tax=Aeromicrobium sp. CF4.19 TaxID=3373082 RepID=UPI003EE80B22
MALLTLASAKGSPGVTTAAMLFGALWPRPSVVLEADPSGGDIALRMPAADGAALDSQMGLSSLVAAGRKSLYPALVDVHAQRLVGGQKVMVGVATPEQARGITQWDTLGRLFAELPGHDTIADLGRVGAGTPQNSLVEASAACVLVVDTLPSNVVHLRERIRRLQETFGRMSGPALSVVVVAPPKRSRAVREVREALEKSELDVGAVHHLAYDPAGAAFFLGQITGNPGRTQLVRSAQPIVEDLARQTESSFVAPEAASPAGDAEQEVTS